MEMSGRAGSSSKRLSLERPSQPGKARVWLAVAGGAGARSCEAEHPRDLRPARGRGRGSRYVQIRPGRGGKGKYRGDEASRETRWVRLNEAAGENGPMICGMRLQTIMRGAEGRGETQAIHPSLTHSLHPSIHPSIKEARCKGPGGCDTTTQVVSRVNPGSGRLRVGGEGEGELTDQNHHPTVMIMIGRERVKSLGRGEEPQ